jgi:hypothetical protein
MFFGMCFGLGKTSEIFYVNITRHILPMKNVFVHSRMASYGVFFTSALTSDKILSE